MGNTQELSGLIMNVFTSQRFAVLSTQFEGQPYSSLIAFAEAKNLKNLIFVTSRDTRKYSNTQVNKRVAVLIDNRTNQASDLQSAVAITAIGTIEEVAEYNRDYRSGIYLFKHPQLADFLNKPSNALMKVEVTDYVVATFEGVRSFSIGETK
jgi:hypothetical protein